MSLENKFNKTNLDITNKVPLGGPNRSNSANVPSIYNLEKSGNLYGNTQAPQGGPLKDKNGKIVKFMINTYTPNNKYLSQFQPPIPTIKDPNPKSSSTSLPSLVKDAEKLARQNGNI
jgi:hypothetical protein